MKRALLLALVGHVAAFKFLSNFKAASLIPRPSAMLKNRKAKQVFGTKKLAVITGTSSGLGLETTAALLRTGEYHVFGAVRDVEKMRSIAAAEGFSADEFTPLQADLNSFESVREFCNELKKAKLNRNIDRLICNAAVYQPEAEGCWSKDSHPQTAQVNFLSHFLMVSLLLPSLEKSTEPRVVFVGSANPEESVGTYPRADLGTLDGLKAGLVNPVSMLDGYNYDGSKSYKDSKLCVSMLATALHERYHKQTGIAFSTIHPGMIENSALFKDKQPLDTSLLGMLRESIGMAEGSSVGVQDAAGRLFQVATDGRCSKSGVQWSWLEGQAAADATKAAEEDKAAVVNQGWETIYEHEPLEEVKDYELAQTLWSYSTHVTKASWPPAYVPKSPCPTLVVIGAVTKWNNAKQDAKRSLEGLERDGGGKLRVKTIGGAAGYAIDAVAGNTIGRVGKIAQEKLLGKMVDEALQGSFQETVVVENKKKMKTADGDGGDALSEFERDGLQRRIDDLAVEKSVA